MLERSRKIHTTPALLDWPAPDPRRPELPVRENEMADSFAPAFML